MVGSRQVRAGIVVIRPDFSCTASTLVQPSSRANRQGEPLRARPDFRPGFRLLASATGGLLPIPTPDRSRRSYQLRRLRLGAAPCGTIPRITVSGPRVWGSIDCNEASRGPSPASEHQIIWDDLRQSSVATVTRTTGLPSSERPGYNYAP